MKLFRKTDQIFKSASKLVLDSLNSKNQKLLIKNYFSHFILLLFYSLILKRTRFFTHN